MNLFGHQWKYINEGDNHIVLQLCGTGKVVRLIKRNGENSNLKDECHSVDFVNNVMIPLLLVTENYNEELVHLSEDQTAVLSGEIRPLRPAHRLHKSILSKHAIIAPNLIMLSPQCESNYSIEIKAKEGFISPAFLRHGKCYYCLKQYLKLQERQIGAISSYCPLDLFSGEKHRMRKSLQSLIEYPQNNFKIFHNGVLIYSDKCNDIYFEDIIGNMKLFNGSVDLFIDFIIEILLGDAKSNLILQQNTTLSKTSTQSECKENNSLQTGSFLHSLYALQTLVKDYGSLKNIEKNNDEWLKELLDFIHDSKLNLRQNIDKELLFLSANPIALGIISAIARDCSILITFSPDYQQGLPKVLVNDHEVPFKISVTDLEPKSLETLKKRDSKERKLLEIYEKEMPKKI